MPASQSHDSARTERINLRATPYEAEIIRSGAASCGKKISQYILESVCKQAEQDLADQRHFYVTEEQMKAFLEALDQPPQPKLRMKRLLEEPSILEEPK